MPNIPKHPLEAYPVKASFWILNRQGEPEFVEGYLQLEEEGSWCEGEERFHAADNERYYISWFNTPEEVLQHEVEMAQFRVDFETDMWKSQLQELEEDRDRWIKKLEEFKKTNVISKSE